MKKILVVFPVTIIFFALLISSNTNNNFTELNGATVILDPGTFGLAKFYSLKKINSSIKDIYVQYGVNFSTTINESGRYLKLNKANSTWYIPINGFLNAGWGMEFPYGSLQCCPVSFFAISSRDTNLIIKFQITPGATCPDAHTLYTKNGGLNWFDAPFSCGGAIIYPNGSDYNPKKDSLILFGYSNLSPWGIYSSFNAGSNWQIFSQPGNMREVESYSPEYSGYGFVKYNPFDTAFVYANGQYRMLISTNGGVGFSPSGIKWLKNLVFSYKDSAMYGYNGYKLYKSLNKGISWDSVITTVKFSSLEINPDIPNILYGGDSLGIYRSTNYGLNWALYNNTFTPSKIIIGISKDAGSGDTFYVATTKKVYKVWASFLVNSEFSQLPVPDKYELFQNYPNPFNPSTSIKYQVASIKHIKLAVYDILGKEIATLVNEKQSPGTYEVNWDASSFPSGIYFYKIISGDYSETKKMIFLK
ncbi:MAG: T9SS type A sorting domain-containing protein [Ignavibacteriae bacterium]|nr:T9SS type A sorting domain-containing protein [Ignavibacteriota bacterium]